MIQSATNEPFRSSALCDRRLSDLFIHLVPDDDGHALAKSVKTLPCTLDDLGLTVSTGRVVDFRAQQWLRAEPMLDTVPLIYPTHFDNGLVRWPKANCKKPNAIIYNSESAALMVPAGVYLRETVLGKGRTSPGLWQLSMIVRLFLIRLWVSRTM